MSLALLVTGAGGQLGTDVLELVRSHPQLGRNTLARGLRRADLDVTDPFAVKDMVTTWARIVRDDSPAHRLVVLNTAAYTAVDAAETDEEAAYVGNATAPALLAQACASVGARLIHVSTDYVFPGDATTPYDVDHPTGPRSAYGRTKLAGEQAVRELLPDAGYVVRTAWLYGATGTNFVKTMARLERDKDVLTVVDDQRGSPTWSRDLAAGLLALAQSADDTVPAGTYHCTNAGETTWCGLARAVFSELGADPSRVHPTTSDAFVRPAPRPAYSVLSARAWNAAGLPERQDWREALAEAFRADPAAYRPT